MLSVSIAVLTEANEKSVKSYGFHQQSIMALKLYNTARSVKQKSYNLFQNINFDISTFYNLKPN